MEPLKEFEMRCPQRQSGKSWLLGFRPHFDLYNFAVCAHLAIVPSKVTYMMPYCWLDCIGSDGFFYPLMYYQLISAFPAPFMLNHILG
jgi:hypothetical protein